MQEAQVKTTIKAKTAKQQKDLSISKYTESKHFTGNTARSQAKAPLETPHPPFLLYPVQKSNLNEEQVTD